MVDQKSDWEKNLHAQLAHWDRWLAGERGQGPTNRLTPDYRFPADARHLLGSPLGATIRALDLGSGPASTIGPRWPGRTVVLTCVDPLAEEYNALLRKHGYEAYATIVKGCGETLLSDLPDRDFDFVYSGNALDHTYDPLLCIQNMIDIAKPGGVVMFMTFENEGVRQGYGGLHKWNFCIEEQSLVLWNRDVKWNVAQRIRHTSIDMTAVHDASRDVPRIRVSIRKAN